MFMPDLGASVHVWPTRPNVQLGEAAFGRFLPPAGVDVTWSIWWASRLRDGDVILHDPKPAVVAAKDESAPTALAGDKK